MINYCNLFESTIFLAFLSKLYLGTYINCTYLNGGQRKKLLCGVP